MTPLIGALGGKSPYSLPYLYSLICFIISEKWFIKLYSMRFQWQNVRSTQSSFLVYIFWLYQNHAAVRTTVYISRLIAHANASQSLSTNFSVHLFLFSKFCETYKIKLLWVCLELSSIIMIIVIIILKAFAHSENNFKIQKLNALLMINDASKSLDW